MNSTPIVSRETAREGRFNEVWTRDLNEVFEDVAPYYDLANYIASLGLWGWFLQQFMDTVDIRPGERVLDVCAGTNAVGIALLKREPTLEMHAIDQSAAMQEVGRRTAESLGFRIHSVINDVHTLPYPDNSFNVVTLQFASRHLRIRRVASEILRVLKPGGRFYHCDMLRPANPAVAELYYAYLRFCLCLTGFVFRSGPAALKCKEYFVQALRMFYSAQELCELLKDAGFRDVTTKTVLNGMLGFHHAAKPPAA